MRPWRGYPSALAALTLTTGCLVPTSFTLVLADAGAPHDGAVDAGADRAITEVGTPDAGDVPDAVRPGPCPPGETRCVGICVDTATDLANCGECGNACVGVCRWGGCESDAGPGCPAGQTVCETGCTDTRTDPANCGECGNGCGAWTCVAGGCVSDAGPACPPGQTDCGAGCVDLATDVDHCGECGNACSGGLCCGAGGCGAGGGTCAPGQSRCGDGCADTNTDLANCGKCGNHCTGTCRAGGCLAP